jgi:hypothetical protein
MRYSITRLYFLDKILHDFEECLKPSDKVSLQTFVALNGWLKKYLKQGSTSTRERRGEHNSLKLLQEEKCL